MPEYYFVESDQPMPTRNKPMPQQNWKEEFYKIGDGRVRFIATRQEVMHFMEKLLAQQRKEIVEEIEKMPYIQHQKPDGAIDEPMLSRSDIITKLSRPEL